MILSVAVEDYPPEYGDRIKELQSVAEDEGITPDIRSLNHFAQFVRRSEFPMCTGSLFLTDSGTYAAVWRNDQWRLNLSFHADGSMDYVLLDRKAEKLTGETGTVDLDAFASLCNRLGLKSVLAV